MCHLADQPSDGFARQPGVGIQCYDVADIVGDERGDAAHIDKAGIRSPGAAAGSVHAACRACVPSPSTAPCTSFQRRRRCSSRNLPSPLPGWRRLSVADAVGGRLQQRSVLLGVLGVRASFQSDSSAKWSAPFGPGQVMNFRAFDIFCNRGLAGEQDRDGDHRTQMIGNAVGEFHAGQDDRREALGDVAVDQGGGKIKRRQETEARQQERSSRRSIARSARTSMGRTRSRKASMHRAGDVAADAAADQETAKPQPRRNAEADAGFQRISTIGNQIEARFIRPPD